MSALPPKADMCDATKDVRFGPIADIGRGRRINLSFLPMRIATISAPIRLANVGNYSLGVVMFDPERSN